MSNTGLILLICFLLKIIIDKIRNNLNNMLLFQNEPIAIICICTICLKYISCLYDMGKMITQITI